MCKMHLLIIYFIICFIFYYNISKGLVSMVRVIVRSTTKIVSYIDKQSHRLTDSHFLKNVFCFYIYALQTFEIQCLKIFILHYQVTWKQR